MKNNVNPDDFLSEQEAHTHKEQVLAYLQAHGSIDRLTAMRVYNIMHLPTRIFYLKRDGYPIQTVMKRSANNKRYGVYVLVKPEVSNG